jgi:hypothetical protein
MKKLMLGAAALLLLAAPAHASGWTSYYDCGHGVVPIFGGWHGKTWLSGVEANHKIIYKGTEGEDQINLFQDLGMDVREGEKPISLNADKTVFDFKVKWHGKTVILHWRSPCSSTSCARNSNEWSQAEVSFGGHICHNMGDGRYEDTEAGRYVKEKE